MPSRSNQQIYLLSAVGFAAGILLLVLLDGAALTPAALPLGLSIGIALRTWRKKHGWNPGITITEDVAEREALRNAGDSVDETSRKPRDR